MKKINLNKAWGFSKGIDNSLAGRIHGATDEMITIDLPHDAMILEERDEETVNGSQSGFYPGGNYSYVKKLNVPKEWQQKEVRLEFEGVYNNARVYINDDLAHISHNGYANFYVNLLSYLKYGEENEIKVTLNNADMPNSRWYTGSGIYRNVNLWLSDLCYFELDGTRIKTTEISEELAVVEIQSVLRNELRQNKAGKLITKIYQADELVAEEERVITLMANESSTVHQRINVIEPKLWSPENPHLYQVELELVTDETNDSLVEEIGIRTISINSVQGFQLNNETVKLRGTCVHHDNGILGAREYYDAEVWKVKKLKEAGFNCIRMSHQPMGKALLQACDRYGMLVIDELSDMWLTKKNDYDYSDHFYRDWEKDVESLVNKDFNHPSVIMYSMGNEIQEAATAKGAALNRQIQAKFKALDSTRYTTNAINALTAISDKLPLIFADVKKMQAEMEKRTKENDQENTDKSGSNELNSMMSILKGQLADIIATHSITSESLREFSEGMDVVGYNYMTARHASEIELYPNRVVMGSETFPSDIAVLWQIVKENAHVIGDMTWTGLDYLGEAGLAGFFYGEGATGREKWPHRTANTGDITITGVRKPISLYREIVYGLRQAPYIAVKRMEKNGLPLMTTPWSFKDNISSWNWSGYENELASVDVYTNADEVELLLNNEVIGRKSVKDSAEAYTANFEVPYQEGELKAINYRKGIASEEFVLQSAKQDEVTLHTTISKQTLTQDELAYVDLFVVDKNDTINRQDVQTIEVAAEGAIEVLAFGSGDPLSGTAFNSQQWETYDGHLLCIVKATEAEGNGTLTVRLGEETKEYVFNVK
ncbi:hypothetical protein BAU15_00945 [Enterococcus sp. JM4C]|uniref:glycoside hydrolase family 2 TIM barrel-domain containing protein n=1 Tax=Candidatus Enterococcus huntleyi TaxID=1857217 RepID=UPI00137B83BD|nr:glycoside hydrolase family 2 TIM barrel-domain containing protein [Enterococcus sp. JM4C]KAF1299244.1 hypothetical protein BAU15_00945 [Enterococcus sp. JM4C]